VTPENLTGHESGCDTCHRLDGLRPAFFFEIESRFCTFAVFTSSLMSASAMPVYCSALALGNNWIGETVLVNEEYKSRR